MKEANIIVDGNTIAATQENIAAIPTESLMKVFNETVNVFDQDMFELSQGGVHKVEYEDFDLYLGLQSLQKRMAEFGIELLASQTKIEKDKGFTAKSARLFRQLERNNL